MNAWKRAFGSQLDLSFSTAHASNGLMGFPSQIVDDPVLQLAMPEPDDFPLAEERRLFYVALTRARRQTRIYSPQDKPSRFVIELAKDGHTEIKIDRATMKLCPKCETGTLSQKTGRYGPFEACSTHPGCDYTKRLLSFNSNETTSAHTVRLKKSIFDGATCPTCIQGTMVERSG
ncbi:hypothetical protein EOK75_00100 [Pseudorhodobacter turbinis]|uniref:DNA topoisomerase type IA zn finger domain-containing protein n=1 Tax=Pseudorhodobacter turbinis TaxID=2500533 RepID=A0A4P8ECJ6_9RHOB|nr:topoisomerase DNA-binding C4 zinc finger domain-containing protein [Pseudorhodobacter turbinis]QCO54373.1 hypothetical protein EOK75_00100 [Pseudorhodobacter turbinis]